MDNRVWKAAIAAAAALVLTACSEAPKPAETKPAVETKKEPPQPPEPVTAKSAFYEMYKPARTWAADLLPLSLASGVVPGMQNEGGKAAKWTAVFVSPGKHEARTFDYAVIDQGADTHKGVSMGGSQVWSGATPKSKTFQVTEFSVNSDAAYQTALEKAGPWLKKHPGKKVQMLLGNTSRYPAPAWYVIWGDKTSGFAVWINATTGTVMTGR